MYPPPQAAPECSEERIRLVRYDVQPRFMITLVGSRPYKGKYVLTKSSMVVLHRCLQGQSNIHCVCQSSTRCTHADS